MKSFFASLCVLCALCGSTFSATPKDEVIRLVPNDAGFVVVLQDFRGHAAKFRDSPFVKQFMQTPQGKALLDASVTVQLAEADRGLTEELGVNWTKLRHDLLGDAVVFVYRPGPVDKPDAEEGVAILYVRDSSVAKTVLTTSIQPRRNLADCSQ